jgi:hypothetical protein
MGSVEQNTVNVYNELTVCLQLEWYSKNAGCKCNTMAQECLFITQVLACHVKGAELSDGNLEGSG